MIEERLDLQSLLNISDENKYTGNEITEERILAQLDNIRALIAFYREYPDYFIDDIKGPDSEFKFYTYQRVILRIMMRHRYTYVVLPRGSSKSFLTMMILMLRCILYPGAEMFVTTGGKEQAASITISKIEQICTLIPALNNELRRERGESKTSTKDVKYLFKNGSSIDVLSATEKSRGQRRTGGAVEECILVDQTALNEIIIPTTVIDRRLADGSMERSECVNKSQVFITTAGYRNQFAYAKLIELLIQSILDPDSAMILGGTYRIPVAEGLQSAEYLDSLKLQDTFSEESFNREYRSRWTGDAENAFYSGEKFDRSRVLKTPEYEYCVPRSRIRDTYYVLGVDVGRIGCTTECCVFRVNVGAQGVASSKSLVNIFTFEAEHFEEQAIHLKRIFLRFQAQAMAIDANGLGVGLVDFMVKSQVDPETGDTLPPFGVINDDDGLYKKYKTRDTVQDAMYLIKANMPFNTEAYSNAQIQMAGGRIKFLVDEATAKVKLLETKEGQDMTLERRNEYLRPFVQTTILREQILNLVESNEGINIILKQASRTIPKDKFSAFIYGLYYIKLEDEKKKKKKGFDINGLIFFN